MPQRALLGELPVKRALLALSLVACGDNQQRFTGPQFKLEGDCAPSTGSTQGSARTIETHCLAGTPAPTLVETPEELQRLLDPNCVLTGSIDFATSKVLVVSARGASEWFTFVNFVSSRTDALEVGLVIRPQGALPPDTLLVLDRAAPALELRWCRSVCTTNCDQALP